ncbi:restriction endonuclease subunit S [Aeromonas media]|uniref:restriction endonuclease subunit S n=1 Tax=Aeromonas media TaxID=651 RepID=UPI00227EFF26|nr:restriction endonuclease subunit S [Aeromonas media]MCY9837154.1 restriction endonuclease subunit S [Aeromonas media]
MAKQMMQDKASEMAATQTIPTGYKQTEVGVIPEDWDILSLGEIFTFKNGINKSKDFFGFGSPIVNYMDVYSSSCIDGECINGLVSVSELEKKNYSAVENDVFFTRTSETVNEVGLSSVLFGRVRDMVFSGFLLRARQRKNFFVGDYMKFCFREKSIRSQIQGTASYTTRALTNGTLLSKVLIPVPAKQEQSIIAKVLSDIDALIAALEQLIAKKQSIKTATMQQLLTGRARLPQFALRPDGTTKGYKTSELGQIPEDWITPTLKDITSNIIDYRGRTPRKLGLEWGGGNILALSAGNVKKGFIDYEAECYFGSDELYKKWMTSGDASKGDIAFTMEAPLGNAALIPNEDKYILSQRTILLQLERSKFLPMFIIQVFLSDIFQSYISESATGSTAQGIKRATFEKMFVAVPSCLEEQTAIATILSDMDSELAALEQKLAKARSLKQGMMQQLLTGRIRLPLPKEA